MPPVLEIMLYPMRDGVHWGASIRWPEDGSERSMKTTGGISREQFLGAIGAVFDSVPASPLGSPLGRASVGALDSEPGD